MELTTSRAREAYVALRQKLLQGELAPGSQLSNRGLATALGLSMTPVREALHRLASDGLVEYVPGAGAFVRRIDLRDLEQIYELRELLEPCAAAHAAESASPRQLDRLKQACDDGATVGERLVARKRSRAAGDALTSKWTDLEAEFHLAVLTASNNPWLVNAVGGLRIVQEVFLAHQSLDVTLLTPDVVRQTLADHSRLFDAILGRDGEAAARLMREHIVRGKQSLLRLLSTESATGRRTPKAKAASAPQGGGSTSV